MGNNDELRFMNFGAMDSVHQPVVICIDTSESMSMDAGNGKSKIQMVEDLINGICDVDLSETEKKSVDICVLGFSNDVYTICDWTNLYDFRGDLKLRAVGTTALNSVILQSIKKVRELRRGYYERSIACRRAQIFVYTDGFSTEPMEEAYDKSMDYFNRQKPSAKLNMIFIPTYYNGTIIKLTDSTTFDDYKQLVKGLGPKVAFINAEDCVNGIPASFRFMMDSIVEWSVSTPGEPVKVSLDKNKLSVINGRGGAGLDDDGNKVVIDTDIDDDIVIV